MGLNDTPQGERTHIAFFGLRNAGKSSLINAITNQNLSIVSDMPGTTTDPVRKAMEILPIGPCMLFDTPGLDDEGTLGTLRVEKAFEVLQHTDLVVLVHTCKNKENTSFEEDLLNRCKKRDIPVLHVINKCDLMDPGEERCDAQGTSADNDPSEWICVSAKTRFHIEELKNTMASVLMKAKEAKETRFLVRDLVQKEDLVVLVIPIDSSAPKGRLILPQQQVLRDLLEAHAEILTVDPNELDHVFTVFSPKLVITDSQIFDTVSQKTPESVLLTSFSILMARYKGYLEDAVRGISNIADLKDKDCILIAEGCTHHRQCEDIGTVKIPRWLTQKTGKQLKFEATQGNSYPNDLKKYAQIVLCGGCMLNAREMEARVLRAKEAKIPVTNYGILIAYMRGILKRSIEIFPDLMPLLPA